MNYNDQSIDTGRRLYYSSSQGPFYNANNIFMFYGGGSRGDIVENVLHAVGSGEPVVHVYGEVGSGKTMLSLVISDRIKHRFHTMRYDLPELSAAKLLRHLLIELVPQSSELEVPEQLRSGANSVFVDKALACIEKQLCSVGRALKTKPYLLFVDSKDAMDAEALYAIERLSEFRVKGQPILYCVVFHTAACDAECDSAGSESMQQSENHFWLRRLNLAEINEYLHHHMMLFDFTRRDLFTSEMAMYIAEHSDGVFKSINTLARSAFTIAHTEGSQNNVSISHLVMAGLPNSKEAMETPAMLGRYHLMALAAMSSSLLACIALLYFAFV